MTKGELIAVSVVADVLDVFVVGQVPGLSWFIDVPVIFMHFNYAGATGFLSTLLELIPVVGTLPIFTIAAFRHEDKG